MAKLGDTLILGLGSNAPDAKTFLQQGIDLIQATFDVEEMKVSQVYLNEAIGFESDHPFYNLVISFPCQLSPLEALEHTENIERQMGRTEKSLNGYASRIIDIDILLYANTLYSSDTLQIPHPRFQERDFVLQPLMDIHPNFIDPKRQLSTKQHLNHLKNNRNLVGEKI